MNGSKNETARFIEILKHQMPRLANQYKVQGLALFGSFVRGEQRRGSDLDVLVQFAESPSLFTFVRLERYLSDLLGVKVDLVMKDALKPTIGKHILREAVYI